MNHFSITHSGLLRIAAGVPHRGLLASVHDSHKTAPSPRSTPTPDSNLCNALKLSSTSERHTVGEALELTFLNRFSPPSPSSMTSSRFGRPLLLLRRRPTRSVAAEGLTQRRSAARTQPQLFLMISLKQTLLQKYVSSQSYTMTMTITRTFVKRPRNQGK